MSVFAGFIIVTIIIITIIIIIICDHLRYTIFLSFISKSWIQFNLRGTQLLLYAISWHFFHILGGVVVILSNFVLIIIFIFNSVILSSQTLFFVMVLIDQKFLSINYSSIQKYFIVKVLSSTDRQKQCWEMEQELL